MPIEDKKKQPLISPEEAIRRAREAQVPQVNTSFKPETSPLNPNKKTFDSRLMPEGYKFGDGVKPDAAVPAHEDERSEQRRAIDELYEAAKQRVSQHPKQERLERAHALISGISDLGRSIANMYFTNQGAPNGFKFDEGMSEAARKRAEKALERREKEREAYYKYATETADMDYKERQSDAKMALKQRELDLRADKLLQAKDEAEWKHGIEEAKLEVQKQILSVQEDFNNKRISLAQQKAAIERLNRVDHRLAEYEENYEYDPVSGKVTKKIRTVKNPDGTKQTEEITPQQSKPATPSNNNPAGNTSGNSTPAKKTLPSPAPKKKRLPNQ